MAHHCLVTLARYYYKNKNTQMKVIISCDNDNNMDMVDTTNTTVGSNGNFIILSFSM